MSCPEGVVRGDLQSSLPALAILWLLWAAAVTSNAKEHLAWIPPHKARGLGCLQLVGGGARAGAPDGERTERDKAEQKWMWKEMLLC